MLLILLMNTECVQLSSRASYRMSPEAIIAAGLQNAIATMRIMIVNEGQESVLTNTIIPKFEQNAEASPEEGWTFVSASPYESFMSETVEAGNQIMLAAYILALKIKKAYQLYG